MSNANAAEKRAMLKDAAILFIITLVAGFLLGFVYDVTKEPIAQQKEKAKLEASRLVFADAADFREYEGFSAENAAEVLSAAAENINLQGALSSFSADSAAASARAEGISGADIDEVSEAYDSAGNLLGYVITVTDHDGYGGDIQFSMGVTLDGTLNGISLLSISETAGLGMKAGDVLVPQFEDKNVEFFTYTKTGSASGNEIDAISGATITTRAIVNGVNAGLEYFRSIKH